MRATLGTDSQSILQDPPDVINDLLRSTSPIHGPHEPSSLEPSPSSNNSNAFQFLDLSSYGEDDKPTTPHNSSSTNASPETNPADSAAHTSSPAVTDNSKSTSLTSDASDPTQLGFMAKIDGGIAEYYNGDAWPWDSIPTSSQDPWAIAT